MTLTIGIHQIVIGVIALVAAVFVGVKVRKFYIKAREAARDIKRVVKDIQMATDETATTPRTLSGVEDLMKQRILKDFPDFNFNVCKQMIDGAITDFFAVLNNAQDVTAKMEKNCTPSFIAEVRGQIATNKTVYENVRIHRTVISDYRKLRDEATVTYQSAVEYKRKGKSLMQYVYESKLVYYLSDENAAGVETLHCTYCGAPIDVVGENKVCRYCGAEISIRNVASERAWKVNKVAKLR